MKSPAPVPLDPEPEFTEEEIDRAARILAGAALRELVFGELRPMAEAAKAARERGEQAA